MRALRMGRLYLEALHERGHGAAAPRLGLDRATEGEDGTGAGVHHRGQGRPFSLKGRKTKRRGLLFKRILFF